METIVSTISVDAAAVVGEKVEYHEHLYSYPASSGV